MAISHPRLAWASSGPGGRYGHSMVLHDTQIVLFGGRADEIEKKHIPKTYTVADRNGTIDFASYWERVYDCDYLLRKAQFTDPNATIDSIGCNQTLQDQSVVDTTFLWNDVWMCVRLARERCLPPLSHTDAGGCLSLGTT